MSMHALAWIAVMSWVAGVAFAIGSPEPKRPWTPARTKSLALSLPGFIALIWLVVDVLT